MGKHGFQPIYTERLPVFLGESIHNKWLAESVEGGLKKTAIARLAIDEYCNEEGVAIIVPTSLPGEEVVRSTLQVTPDQRDLLSHRAKLLDTSMIKITCYAVAFRYVNVEFEETRLLIAKAEL